MRFVPGLCGKTSTMPTEAYIATNRAISRLSAEGGALAGVERVFATSSGAVHAALADVRTVEPLCFSTDPATCEMYWKVRKGTFPAVGAMRRTGTTVLIEDVAFPIASLADATLDLQQLLPHTPGAVLIAKRQAQAELLAQRGKVARLQGAPLLEQRLRFLQLVMGDGRFNALFQPMRIADRIVELRHLSA